MNAAPLEKAAKTGKRIVKYLNLFARGLEIVISVIVLFAVLIQIFSLRNLLYVFVLNTDSMRSFHTFLDNILVLVIGLEFFRMLCFTNADTVLEVVLFVLAAHDRHGGFRAGKSADCAWDCYCGAPESGFEVL